MDPVGPNNDRFDGDPDDGFSDVDLFGDVDLEALVAEEADAARRRAAIEAGRRRGGVAGAAVAGIMVALADIYEPRARDEIAIVVDAAGDPGDIDAEGVELWIDGIGFTAPPPDDI